MQSTLQSRQGDPSITCRELLDEMNCLYKLHGAKECCPDLSTYTLLVKGLMRSREEASATTALAIVEHLEEGYRNGTGDIIPDGVLYNIILTICAQREPRMCQPILQRMERLQSHKRNILTTVSYNIVLDSMAKAGQARQALKLLRGMHCQPDVVTYTSCIDAMAKNCDGVAAEKLLNELEEAYQSSGRAPLLKPNIRTYTSVSQKLITHMASKKRVAKPFIWQGRHERHNIAYTLHLAPPVPYQVVHAYARERKDPERAEQIMKRLERAYDTGNGVQPDTTFYNALLNAYGWATDYQSKAKKCGEILQHMIDLYESGRNVDAKPDLITCNSVLNAAAFSPRSKDPLESKEIMEIAVGTADLFASENYGQVDHMTFVNLLLTMVNHMPAGSRRTALATTTFWRCCQTGNLSVPVVTGLYRVLDWKDFENLLGPALLSRPDDKMVRFQLGYLPASWSRFAPKPKERSVSRPSRKSSNYRATRKISLRKQQQRR